MRTIRIGTRNSQLALAQTMTVVNQLEKIPDFHVEIKKIRSFGDLRTDIPLTDSNQTGIFTSALEEELINGKIDIAIHSLKDLPLQQPPGLRIAAFPTRESPHEVLVIAKDKYYPEGFNLPIGEGARVGTGSPRRRAQLLSQRPDLNIELIRGNINTRMDKTAGGLYDAAVFAEAGLKRINIHDDRFVFFLLDPAIFVSSPGQGVLAVEMREDDPDLVLTTMTLNDSVTESCVKAERKVLELLGGGCSLPLGVTATIDSSDKWLRYRIRGFWNYEERSRWICLRTNDLELGAKMVYKRLIGR